MGFGSFSEAIKIIQNIQRTLLGELMKLEASGSKMLAERHRNKISTLTQAVHAIRAAEEAKIREFEEHEDARGESMNDERPY